MRKLIATVAASTAVVLAASAATASSTSMTYSDSNAAYKLCVTNGGSGDAGYDILGEINFTGLKSQPTTITAPAAWNSASYQDGTTWTLVLWTNGPATGLTTSTTANCGFSFTDPGATTDTAVHTAQLWYYSSSGAVDPNMLTLSVNAAAPTHSKHGKHDKHDKSKADGSDKTHGGGDNESDK